MEFRTYSVPLGAHTFVVWTPMQVDAQSSNDMRQHHQPHHHHQLHAGGLDFSCGSTPALSLMDRRFMPSPPPAPSTPSLSCLHDPAKPTTTSPGAHHWTFEEQFKQVTIAAVVLSA